MNISIKRARIYYILAAMAFLLSGSKMAAAISANSYIQPNASLVSQTINNYNYVFDVTLGTFTNVYIKIPTGWTVSNVASSGATEIEWPVSNPSNGVTCIHLVYSPGLATGSFKIVTFDATAPATTGTYVWQGYIGDGSITTGVTTGQSKNVTVSNPTPTNTPVPPTPTNTPIPIAANSYILPNLSLASQTVFNYNYVFEVIQGTFTNVWIKIPGGWSISNVSASDVKSMVIEPNPTNGLSCLHIVFNSGLTTGSMKIITFDATAPSMTGTYVWQGYIGLDGSTTTGTTAGQSKNVVVADPTPTSTPVPPTATYTYSHTRTFTPTFTPTWTPIPPTFTYTHTYTRTYTPTFTPTWTPVPYNNADFLSQVNVPTSMIVGETRSVTLNFNNNGTTTWTEAALYHLGAQDPEVHGVWIPERVHLGGAEAVAPGQTKSWTFNITAPTTPGNYRFRWRMVQEYVEWFGEYSTDSYIQVLAYTPTITPTWTITKTWTRTASPTITLTITQTVTPTYTITRTITPTRTITQTSTITRTKTPTPTITPTSTITKTCTRTATRTVTPTNTPYCTPTPTSTATVYLMPEEKVITYPSPAKGDWVWFYYHMEGPARVRIEVYNILGEHVDTVTHVCPAAGYYQTPWDIRRTAPGIYTYIVWVERDGAGRRQGLYRLMIVKK